jgi:hypothetical protein
MAKPTGQHALCNPVHPTSDLCRTKPTIEAELVMRVYPCLRPGISIQWEMVRGNVDLSPDRRRRLPRGGHVLAFAGNYGQVMDKRKIHVPADFDGAQL